MASSSDVVKKVMRLKLQLADPAESATVLKILQKLKDLDITLDVLAETGIGKAVNSLRRHQQAGEIAKSLVRGWKKLVPKESSSHATGDGDVSETTSVKEQLVGQECPNTTEDLNGNSFTPHGKTQDSSDETGSKRADPEKRGCEEQGGKKNENQEKSPREKQSTFQGDVLEKKMEEDETDDSCVSQKKKDDQGDRKSGDGETLPGNKSSEDPKSRPHSGEKLKNDSDGGRFESERESHKNSKPSRESSKEGKDILPGESRLSGISRSPEAQRKERKRSKEKPVGLKRERESDDKERAKHRNKKAKTKHKDKRSGGDGTGPSVSFESCLNYDVNVLKRKERCGGRKPPKRAKTEATRGPGRKPVAAVDVGLPRRCGESVLDLLSIPLPALLPDCDKPASVEYFERKVERESDFCDASEESAVFTGQRLNRKMQVYSGAKTIFLPAMMSLYQQCIRILQNNINLLYETGGVPFEILEPVLERCTPEQLLRIEECNPIYIGVTDHLWGKHCQRDFKDSRLQEYESWKEMYVRLSEERERKLQRLTKSIVSAHSNKPKGRQVKMAFIHTVAKPPRDVRIQQEIHGTAVQQPHQPRCSVKVQDNRLRPSCNEPTRSSSSSSGGSNTQDPRKKTRVAPMMAKSLKAFKKQLGRR